MCGWMNMILKKINIKIQKNKYVYLFIHNYTKTMKKKNKKNMIIKNKYEHKKNTTCLYRITLKKC